MVNADMVQFAFAMLFFLVGLLLLVYGLVPLILRRHERNTVAAAVRERAEYVARQKRQHWTHPPVRQEAIS